MIKFFSKTYTLQDDTTREGKISTAGGIVVKGAVSKLCEIKYKVLLGA